MHRHLVESRDLESSRKITGILLLLLLCGFIVQFVGSWYADYTSAISDAFHMLADGASQMVYWLVLTIAVWSTRPPKKLFPWLSSILQRCKESSLWRVGNTICGLLLFVAASFTMVRAFQRLAYPEPARLEISFPVVVFGLLVNLVNLLVIVFSNTQDDLKGILLHVKSDLYHSVIVLVSHLIIWGFGEQYGFVDSLLVFGLGVMMLRWSRTLFQGMQFTVVGIHISIPAVAVDHCASHDHNHNHNHAQGQEEETVHKDKHTCCSG